MGRILIGRTRRPRPGDPLAAEAWFERGCEHEDAGRLHEAQAAYRRALVNGRTTASVCFNLANVLYRLRRKAEAIDLLREAVRSEPSFHEAWNNLGVVLADLGQLDDASWAFKRANSLAPWFADAIYNLADCLQDQGLSDEAQPWWRQYARLDAASAWGKYARSCIARD
ncbi:MAG: tetratricopeptide repeat protein [Planctomycetia bacterium]|nr:tetratricopeptide repeat protein [Planctomycetia bacterium]